MVLLMKSRQTEVMSHNSYRGSVKNSLQGELRILCIIFVTVSELNQDYSERFITNVQEGGCTYIRPI